MPSVSRLRIVVARRPDAAGNEAEELAAWLSRTCEVTIQTVTILPTIWPVEPPSKISKAHRKWVDHESEGCRTAALAALSDSGVPDKYLADEPFVFIPATSETAALNEAAKAFDADMVIIGSHLKAEKNHFKAGSTADALLHCSPLPLALSPRSPKLSKQGVSRVNCAYVDTEQSKEALRKACDLAQRWSVPLRLVAFAPRGASMYPTQTPFKHNDEAMVEWREQALALLDRGRERAVARHEELTVEVEIGSGDGWSGSIEDVSWKKGDLMIVGSSSLGVFGHVFLGSSTNQIVRYCPVPSIIVPV